MEGEGTILGSVLVIDKDGQVLLHHKEQSWGDHPSDEDLFAAITKLGSSSPSSSSLQGQQRRVVSELVAIQKKGLNLEQMTEMLCKKK